MDERLKDLSHLSPINNEEKKKLKEQLKDERNKNKNLINENNN